MSERGAINSALQRFVDHLPLPAAVIDETGRLLVKNAAWTEAAAASPADFVREPPASWPASQPPEDRTFWLPLEAADRFRTYLAIRPAAASCEAEKDVRRRALEEAFERYQAAFLVLDRKGRILWMNALFRRWFFVPASAVGRPIADVFRHLPEEQTPAPKRLIAGGEVREEPFTWMRNGKPLHLVRDSYALGDIGAVLLAFKEIGRYANIDDKILRADRLATIGQMAAGTAHEIRNPLTSLRGFLQLLETSLAEHGLEKEREYVHLMLKEILRINALVDQFLLLGKPQAVRYRKLRLPAVVAEIVPVLAGEAMLHDIVLENHVQEPLPPIIGDPELIKQVLLNIVKNAIEAVERRGTITLTADVDPEMRTVHLNVHDTGPGIPPYLVDRIFDPFFTTKKDGTGLGLAVCQRIIQDLGGQIRVISKGFGTTMQIVLPYVDEAESGAAEARGRNRDAEDPNGPAPDLMR
ncbi:MAG: PAS domain-containing protein [Hydrogenibacillus schlegelii]|nr:PAS domain-containing protein [Hydrogenibacillus schlegelii]